MDITTIVQIIVAVITTIISRYVVIFIKSKTTATERQEILFWIDVAVSAAEQLSKVLDTGSAKKNYVLEFLRNKGFDVNSQEIDAMVEAAVYELKNMLI